MIEESSEPKHKMTYSYQETSKVIVFGLLQLIFVENFEFGSGLQFLIIF